MGDNGADQPRPGLARAVWRGLRGRCPACGRGALLSGYIAPIGRCSACGEDLARYQTADFAPYLVVFTIGLIFIPLTLAASVLAPDYGGLTIAALLTSAVSLALVLLPRAKGGAIALLWGLGVSSNQ